jgi:hypothetical protein
MILQVTWYGIYIMLCYPTVELTLVIVGVIASLVKPDNLLHLL